jgi:hypothetical protein
MNGVLLHKFSFKDSSVESLFSSITVYQSSNEWLLQWGTLSALSTLLWNDRLIRFPCTTRMSSYFVNKRKAPQDIYVHIMFCLWNVVLLFNNILAYPSISLDKSELRMLNNSPSINMSMKMITWPIQSSVPKT